jgi:aromatic-L-amino-acid decarboxylase
MAGRHDLPPLTLYCSEQSHSSIEKDAITLGIGQENVRKIATDGEFRLDTAALRRAVEEDVAAGRCPFCVVAAVGTTSTTSVDPVPAIADVAGEYGMWLHVDAAYAGAAAVLPEMRWLMDGVERADSVVINPHKWLFTPVDFSAFFSPRLDVVRAAFSLVPEYLRTTDSDAVRNYMDYGPQLGRRFRALKLWFVLRAYGREGIALRLREHIRLAQEFARWVDEDPEWERLAPTPFSTVCFRAHPASIDAGRLDALNQRIMDRINATGEAFISQTRLHDKLTLRAAIGHIRSSEDDVRRLWQLLTDALRHERVADPSPSA